MTIRRSIPSLLCGFCALGLLACDSGDDSFEGVDADALEAPTGKADGPTDARVRAVGGGFDELTLRGSAAEELHDAMVRSGFETRDRGNLTYAFGTYSLCVSNGSAAACAMYSREVTLETGDFKATVHGQRFDSAASEIFAALAHSQGVSPGSVSEVHGSALLCGKTSSEVWCGFHDPRSEGRTLELHFDGLEKVGPDFVYEGWLITPDGPVTSGRFDVDESGRADFEISEELAGASSMFVLTLEPAVGDDPAPASTHVLAGAFNDGSAELTVEHPAALGTDFADATGTFILETPSTASIADDYSLGVWFLDPSAGPGASLRLPELPDGWVYEGWAVGADGPVSTGRFVDSSGADEDLGGPAAGPDGTPPFPGQDFIDPKMDLIGGKIVLSVEPNPDYSDAPYAIKPLAGDVSDAGAGASQSLGNMALQTLPSGAAIWR